MTAFIHKTNPSLLYFFKESQVYYKIVKCSESPQIEQELNSLMPGKSKLVSKMGFDK